MSFAFRGALALSLATTCLASTAGAGEPELRPGLTIPFVAVSAGVGALSGCAIAASRGCYLGSILGAAAGVPLSMTYAHFFGDLRTQPWLMTLLGSIVGATPILFVLEPKLAVLSMITPVTTAIGAAAAPMLIEDPPPHRTAGPAISVVLTPGGAITALSMSF
ncbi:MAG: hypothetical protein HY791_28535 [Deltaproteobacteria bacterium]|nr:hypothetical protein [Deltaproteobacteria bacterium]